MSSKPDKEPDIWLIEKSEGMPAGSRYTFAEVVSLLESFSASQNSELKKENEELKAAIIKGEKYLETVSEQLGAAVEDYNNEKKLCRERQATIIEKDKEIAELKEGFVISLKVLKTMMKVAKLEHGIKKTDELLKIYNT